MFLDKVKSWGWVKTLGIVLGAVLLALAAGKAASKHKSAARKEQLGTDLLNSGISAKIAKGKKMVEAANVDKDKAVAAKQKMEAQLEALGDKNEDLADVANRFNKRSVRQ